MTPWIKYLNFNFHVLKNWSALPINKKIPLININVIFKVIVINLINFVQPYTNICAYKELFRKINIAFIS